ncbi:hypothetical protein Hanom_Chr03g00263701 [Helianthus anomalus]
MSSIWSLDTLFVQLFIASFGVLNSWPIYEAMVLRKDKGRIHVKTIVISLCLAFALCGGASLALYIRCGGISYKVCLLTYLKMIDSLRH